MKFLAISRALVSFATSLHLGGLKTAIKISERRVKRMARFTDAAVLSVTKQTIILSAAKGYAADRRTAERQTVRDHAQFVGAVKAEADSLRRDHGVA